MKLGKYLSGLFIILLHLQVPAQSSGVLSNQNRVSNIPPLGALIDSAMAHSPLLNQQESMIRIREYQMKSQKLDWTRYLEAYSDYHYGTIDNVTIAAGGTSVGLQQGVSSRFSVGTRIGLSVFDLLDQRRKVKVAQEQLNFEEYKMDEVKKLVKNEVIKLYNQLTYMEKLILIKNDYLTQQNLNQTWAKKSFESGDINIEQYSQVVLNTSKAREEFELAKKDWKDAYMLLEELIGVSISSMSK